MDSENILVDNTNVVANAIQLAASIITKLSEAEIAEHLTATANGSALNDLIAVSLQNHLYPRTGVI